MTLLDVIVEVGGLTQFAAGNRSRVVRAVNGEAQETRVRLDDLLRGKIKENMPMRPGDVVIIPEARF
jgi:polysaccharide export outer membrane protein